MDLLTKKFFKNERRIRLRAKLINYLKMHEDKVKA
ncbi:hypothetical protein NEOC95_001075 [Neochlamydia sp. AcF95]|nr:hypothetical protein [Neochlamydia sp. AcF95]